MPWDGSEIVRWWDGKRKMEVDMDEVRVRWRRWNWELVRRDGERWCGGCGRACKGRRGLKAHERACQGPSGEMRDLFL